MVITFTTDGSSPSKSRLILTRIIGIEIDVQARYATIAKRCRNARQEFCRLPTTYQTFCRGKCLQRRDNRLKEWTSNGRNRVGCIPRRLRTLSPFQETRSV